MVKAALTLALLAAAILVYLVVRKAEPLDFPSAGVRFSTAAGILGAIGALGIVFALKNGGHPLSVVPLVFAGAPIVGTIVGMIEIACECFRYSGSSDPSLPSVGPVRRSV